MTGAAVALLVAAVVISPSRSHHGSGTATASATASASAGKGSSPATSNVSQTASSASQAGDASTLVATLHGNVARYAGPGGPKVGEVPGSWFGSPSELPVIAQNNGYLNVRLAQRPNGSTAWISAADATLSATPYRIVLNLQQRHLMLFDRGTLVMDAPAGIGTGEYPTPTGHFFVAFYGKPPNAAWGPFIVVTSGHSNAISDWERSGDAIMAIHGPLGSDSAIGSSGGQVSHGCVRLHNSDLVKLQSVPPGSPIDVVA